MCVCVCVRVRVCVCVVSVIVKRPVLPPCVVDGRSRNPLCYYYEEIVAAAASSEYFQKPNTCLSDDSPIYNGEAIL